MNTTHSTKTKRLIAAVGVTAAAAVAPALLFAGAGTAHADDCGILDSIQDCLGPILPADPPSYDPSADPWANTRPDPAPSGPLQLPPDYVPNYVPQTTMGPYTGPVPPEQNKIPNPYCSSVFWPSNLPIEGSGGECPP